MSDRPQVRDPGGRLVVFDSGAELHLAIARPAMLVHVEAILATVARPDHRADDPRAGRERFYRRDLDPQRWLRVVVDFNETPARIVTAFVQDRPPRGWIS